MVKGAESVVGKCDNLYGFVKELQRLVSALTQQTLYIVSHRAS